MLVHNVYFWLKEGLSEEERAAFRAGVESLCAIEMAEAAYVGTPADTADRPVVDKSFDFGLTVLCKNVADHDAYQDDPIHHAFVEKVAGMWERVLVRDAD